MRGWVGGCLCLLAGGTETQTGWVGGFYASDGDFLPPQKRLRRSLLLNCWMTFSVRLRQLPASIGSH